MMRKAATAACCVCGVLAVGAVATAAGVALAVAEAGGHRRRRVGQRMNADDPVRSPKTLSNSTATEFPGYSEARTHVTSYSPSSPFDQSDTDETVGWRIDP